VAACSEKGVKKMDRKAFDSLILLDAGLIGKERNDGVFNNAMKQAAQIASWIAEEGQSWSAAGYCGCCQIGYSSVVHTECYVNRQSSSLACVCCNFVKKLFAVLLLMKYMSFTKKDRDRG
jgi:hypothetical protein